MQKTWIKAEGAKDSYASAVAVCSQPELSLRALGQTPHLLVS